MRAKRKAKLSGRPASGGSPDVDPQAATAGALGAVAAASTPQWGLHLLVFTAGGVLMGLEIAGSRVLAPHFGNSVFVWGSLISVFLTALSAGYYLGGRVADRFPSRLLLHGVVACVALSMFVMAVVADGVSSRLVQLGLGEQSGPLVASLLLFLAPSVGMGMVSPFAIRLATSSVRSVGTSAGNLYALSTFGSIAGTLLTTFVLIPGFGLSWILKGLAGTLLLVAILTVPFWRRTDTMLLFIGIGLFAGVFWVQPIPKAKLQAGERLLLSANTPYHHISVIDNQVVRELRFDQYVETAVVTREPFPSVAGYTDYFHLAMLLKPNIDRALFIGAGGGVGPRTFARHQPDMEIDVVDIDPKVLEIAQDYFFLEPSPRMHLFAEDGRMFLRKSTSQYDCIVLDAFTIGGRIPFHLVTREFFELCRERMSEEGVLVMNINSAVEGPNANIFRSTFRTIDSVFEHTYVFAKGHRERGLEDSMNVIFVASNGPPLAPEDWQSRAESYFSASYVDRQRLKPVVEDLLVETPDVSAASLFTDDYAPIEMMAF